MPKGIYTRNPIDMLALVERNKQRATHRHSRTNSRIYRIWGSMKSRCFTPADKSYKSYGERGITVCQAWMQFETFLEDMGVCPPGLSIDRIDVNGNYEPGNCRWATVQEQANNKRSNRPIRLQGRIQNIAEWARELGMSRQALKFRIDNHWGEADILGLPLNHANHVNARKRTT